MAQVTKEISPVEIKARADLDIRAGDTVRVYVKIQEKGKTRLQPFEGLVLARKHGREAGATITVRRVASGVGVERIFPLYSPIIERIETVRKASVRRSKLYYIRDKATRAARRKFKRIKLLSGEEQRDSGNLKSDDVPVEETPIEEKSVVDAPAEETKDTTETKDQDQNQEEVEETKEETKEEVTEEKK